MAHFHDPAAATRDKVAEVIASGRTPVVQFRSPADFTEPDRINSLCCEFGPSVQIRFFSWQWREFDASLLSQLPDVANLSLDTLRAIHDVDTLARLPKLTQLRFGVHEIPDGQFLDMLPLERLTHLNLGENKRRNFDLSPLARAGNLEHLFIQGHHRAIETIGTLPRLSDVSLSGFPKRHDLAFLSELAALRSLLLILGSRESITEFTHPHLQKLKIIWVRLLEELGPLRRLAALETLSIEDQIRITELDLSGLKLRRLRIANCKQLRRIIGLEEQRLEYFYTRDTKLPRELQGSVIPRPA